MKKPMLSLCMIVKNEEAMLPRCLASVKDWVDEIVVVDTGSTDRTVEIAQTHGARVYHHPWEGDFSKHQNQSVDYASGSWVLQMDGDEELQEGSGPVIRRGIEDPRADAFYLTVLSFFNRGVSVSRESKIRLFRKSPRIRYENIVHKQLRGYRCAGTLPAVILHYGYDLPPAEQAKKFERTSSLLLRQVAEDPGNYWHRHNLAVCYASNGLYEKAIESGLSALAQAEKQGIENSNLLWTLYTIAASCLKLGNLDRAREFSERALSRSRDHLDSHFVLVLVHHRLKEWQAMEAHAKEYLSVQERMRSKPEAFTGAVINTAGETWRVYVALGDLDLERGRPAEAADAFQQASKSSPVPSECLRMIGDCYKTHSLWTEAARCYRESLQNESALEPLLGLALCLRKRGENREAAESYEQALEIDPACVEALVHLGDIHYEKKDWEGAYRNYAGALELEPRLVQAGLRLARLSFGKGNIEVCLRCCENILRAVNITPRVQIDSLNDLARLFLTIGHEMDRAGREYLFRESVEVALLMKPDLIQGLGEDSPMESKR
jgi:tetratricopeptide (TPR) repeat protein